MNSKRYIKYTNYFRSWSVILCVSKIYFYKDKTIVLPGKPRPPFDKWLPSWKKQLKMQKSNFMYSRFKINNKWYSNQKELADLISPEEIPTYKSLYKVSDSLSNVNIATLCRILGQDAVSDGSNFYFGIHIEEVDVNCMCEYVSAHDGEF